MGSLVISASWIIIAPTVLKIYFKVKNLFLFAFRQIIIVFQAFNPNCLKKKKSATVLWLMCTCTKRLMLSLLLTPQIHVALLDIDLSIFTLLSIWGWTSRLLFSVFFVKFQFCGEYTLAVGLIVFANGFMLWGMRTPGADMTSAERWDFYAWWLLTKDPKWAQESCFSM